MRAGGDAPFQSVALAVGEPKYTNTAPTRLDDSGAPTTRSAKPSPLMSSRAPLLVSTGLLARDQPTQNCQVAVRTVSEPDIARTRQYTHPVGSAVCGTALRPLSAMSTGIGRGVAHARSRHSSTTGAVKPSGSVQRSVGRC